MAPASVPELTPAWLCLPSPLLPNANSAASSGVDPVLREPPELPETHNNPEPLTGDAKAKADAAAVKAALAEVEELLALLLVEAEGPEGAAEAAQKQQAAEKAVRVLRDGPEGARLGAARAIRLAAADAAARAAVYKAGAVPPLVAVLRAGPSAGKAQKEAGAALVALAEAQVPAKPPPAPAGWFWSGSKETQEEKEFKALEARVAGVDCLD